MEIFTVKLTEVKMIKLPEESTKLDLKEQQTTEVHSIRS